MTDPTSTILERLRETIEWCSPRVDMGNPKDCLRTPALRPHPLENGRREVVDSVVRSRHIALHYPQKQPISAPVSGRLLVYEPDLNLAHGLEESETGGYFDIDNIPPWDTWIDYVYEPNVDYLLSWVPGPFVELVAAGIAVNPEGCIQFLDDTDFELLSRLKERGVIA